MNTKKLSVYGLFLAITGGVLMLFAPKAFAIPVVASNIDMDASYVQVVFSPEAGVTDPPPFSCFGDTSSPATGTLTELGINAIDLPNPSVVLNETCFQQAGDYTVTVHLEDNAGNSVDKGPYEYRVKADDVDPSYSLIVKTDCGVGTLANGTDECDLDLELRDAFNNPVTQITNTTLTLTTNNFGDDANEGVQFIDGLKLNGGNPKIPVGITGAGGDFSFALTALSPTVQKVGNWLATLVDRVLDFTVVVMNIEDNGDLGTAILNTPISTEGLAFEHLFELEPSGEGFVWEGELETQGTITLDLDRNDPTGPNIRFGELDEHNDNLSYTNQNIPFTGIDLTGIDTYPVVTSIAPLEGLTYENDQILSLSTKIEYQVAGSTIKYPAGGAGLDSTLGGVSPLDVIGYNADITVPIVGADIEGGVIGSLEKMEIQPKATIQTFNVSESTAKLRDQITENVFRLARGSSNVRTPGTFSTSWFDEYDVVIVKVEDGNVIFPGGNLPAGRKTLIIQNGNFIIEGDMTYQNPEDSFGVILINDVQNDHSTGNIFVRSSVRSMVGSYYADGGLMTNDEAVPTVENSSNAEAANFTQLILTGTLFSQNTLGGSMITDDNGNYYTPWGTTQNKDAARLYDLHYVRRYQKDLVAPAGDDDNISNCAPSAGNCDSNENAFVIRIDRKASVAPPPGFESSGSIIR